MNNSVLITSTTQMPTAAILRSIFTLLVVLTERVVKALVKVIAATRTWLITKHKFFDDGDPVVCTGWQFVGIAFISCVVAFILGIDYTSLFI